MLIDTHAHLWWDSYREDLEEVIARAREAGVEKFVVPGTDLETSRQAVGLAKKYLGMVYAAAGIHPEESAKLIDQKSKVEALGNMIMENRKWIVAVGEVGTDKNNERMQECMNEQMELLKAQCELALEFDLPMIIHTRQSLAETLQVLDKLPKVPRGQFHCFSHDEEGLKEVLARGFYVSFCGNVSWSKRVQKLVPLVPLERLLLETDSPLMTPRNQKGELLGGNERNEPANVKILALLQAELQGTTISVLGEQTTENANRLFGI